ncbi:hypothetical protein GCM10017667_55190 [Streptomyces filamentosus]|uniref:Uncharacterized protein n=1 Tax=Streptomyces filamentosus TaxID=67294 RepID=A0A919ERR3_STRFL|nr:hypothetical protein GCM10017667_55190 [Streptomyces filamentosus]
MAHRAHMVVRAAQDQHGPVTVSSSGAMGKLFLESRDFGSGKVADIGEHIRDQRCSNKAIARSSSQMWAA